MLTVEDCINDLNKADWYEKEVSKTGILQSFQTVKKYESLFYQTHSCYSRHENHEIISELRNRIKSIRLKTPDNNYIDIWDINPYKEKRYIIFCQGISSEKSNLYQQKAYFSFVENGWGIIAFDYRGRGRSEGEFSQDGALDDVKTVYNYLISKGIKPADIGIIGHSMGTGVAVDFSCRINTAFTILINPFSKASDMAKNIARKVKMPALIKKVLMLMPSFLFPLKNKFDNVSALAKIKSPVLILHTRRDRTIPVQLARKLYNSNQNFNITYLEIDGDDHEINPEKIDICLDFLHHVYTRISKFVFSNVLLGTQRKCRTRHFFFF